MNYSYVTQMPDLTGARWLSIDTEFSGVDFRTQTCPFRSQCHVFSIAAVMPGGAMTPRGFLTPTAWVLSRFRLSQIPAGVRWYAHNASVDYHTLANAGVDVTMQDTLSVARIRLPAMLTRGGYSLDNLSERLLGVGKAGSFKDLVGRPRLVQKTVKQTGKDCSCGASPCRKRGPSHTKMTRPPLSVWVEKGTEEMPLTDIKPGHERWDRLVEYAARDAWLTCALAQKLEMAE